MRAERVKVTSSNDSSTVYFDIKTPYSLIVCHSHTRLCRSVNNLGFLYKKYCLMLPMDSISMNIWILLFVACGTINAISRQKETQSRDYVLFLFWMTSRVIYSAQYYRQHCTLYTPLNSFEHCKCTTTMTNIRTWYPQVTSPSRYVWAIGAGPIILVTCRARGQSATIIPCPAREIEIFSVGILSWTLTLNCYTVMVQL